MLVWNQSIWCCDAFEPFENWTCPVFGFPIKNICCIVHRTKQEYYFFKFQAENATINLDTASREIEEAVTSYLRRATETFDLSKNVEVTDLSFYPTLSAFYLTLKRSRLAILTFEN
jgi:hypothetical protein